MRPPRGCLGQYGGGRRAKLDPQVSLQASPFRGGQQYPAPVGLSYFAGRNKERSSGLKITPGGLILKRIG